MTAVGRLPRPGLRSCFTYLLRSERTEGRVVMLKCRRPARHTRPLLALGVAALLVGLAACDGQNQAVPTSTLTPTPGLPPVLILHGFRGGPSLRSFFCPRDEQEASAWGEKWIAENPIAPGSYSGLKEEIAAMGFPVSYSHYLSSPCYTATYTDSVQYLAKDIKA